MLRLLSRCSPRVWALGPLVRSRPLSTSSPFLEKPLPPRIKFDEADLTVSYLKGSGPGGQKINKTNSAVQLTHKPTGLVVKSQETRSRSQNRKIAERLMADRVEHMLRGDQSRVAIKADRAKKKKASKMKKSRRKYRRLEEAKRAEAEGEEAEAEEGEGAEEGEENAPEEPKVQRQDHERDTRPTGG